MKGHVNAEASRLNHPVADKLAEEINKIELKV